MINAFRHHSLVHTHEPLAERRHFAVLNAFRHHSLVHRSSLLIFVRRAAMCSTPFGITAWFTPVRGRARPRYCTRAQRLSASQLGSPCQTRSGCVPSDSAQRLSASQLGSHENRLEFSHCSVCAQRLSASQLGSPTVIPGALQGNYVLNAFRHHSLVHWIMPRQAAQTAAGAQRLSASQLGSRLPRLPPEWIPKCSTPFGITAWFTDGSPMAVPLELVCSTPFGITAWFTLSL